MSQCQQNSVMCSVCNRSPFFAFYLENEAFAQKMPFLKNVLKLSILPIESIFIIEFHVGLKVKIAKFGNSRKFGGVTGHAGKYFIGCSTFSLSAAPVSSLRENSFRLFFFPFASLFENVTTSLLISL